MSRTLGLALLVCLLVAGLLPVEPIHAEQEATTSLGSRVLIPDGKAKGLRPVLILLPFTGGGAQQLMEWNYASSLPALMQETGLLVVIPQGDGSADDYATGAAWTATLDRFTRDVAADADELVRKHGGDPRRILLGGYSMGGDLAWALVMREPARYAGAVVMGSRASYRAKGALETFASRGGRLAFFMGSGESDARLAGVTAAIAELDRARVPYRSLSSQGGHDPAPAGLFDQALRFLLGAEREGVAVAPPPVPEPEPTRDVPLTAGGAPILASLPACDATPFEDSATELTGYRNARGKVVVPPRFTVGMEFGSKGVAAVVLGRSFGYIDCKGRFFETLSVDNGPDDFHEGLVRIRDKGRVGYANLAGQVVISPRFEDADGFCRGVARVGEQCRTRSDGEHRITECRGTRYIDTRGRFVPEPAELPDPDNCDIAESTEVVDALPTCDWESFEDPGDDALAGYRNAKGKVMVKPRFTSAGDFDEDGLAPVFENYSASYMDCSGKTFPVMWNDGPDAFSEGLVRYEGNTYDIGYRNRRGAIVIPAKYTYASPFCNGVARVGNRCTVERSSEDSREIVNAECSDWQLIDTQGKRVKGKVDPEQVWECGW